MSSPDSTSRARRFTPRATAWAAGFVLAGAFYLLLIDITSLPELIVGAVAAALAASAFELAREQQTVGGLSARLRWLGTLHRPMKNVPGDIAMLSLLAFRQLVRPKSVNGTFRAVPFRCGDDQQLETGRRAMAEAFGSFSPNTIVVGVDGEQELILGHQLLRQGGREAIDVLRLGGN
jgi:hypothetical protein